MEVDPVPETEVTENDALDAIHDMSEPLKETAANMGLGTVPSSWALTSFFERRHGLYCAIKSCGNYEGKPQMRMYTTFYPFPESAEFKAKWVALCRPKEFLNTKNARVCSSHFLPTDFYFIGNEKYITQHAIPSENLPQERTAALHCAIKYCGNYEGKPRMNRYTIFYPFPESAELRAKWVALCRPGEYLNTDNARVCDEHFLPRDFFFSGGEKHITQHVIPTANLHEKPAKKWRDRCAVMDCSSHKDLGRKVTYHKFPKSGNLRNQWIQRCRRKDKTTWDNAYICSDHFTPDDYRKRPDADRDRIAVRERLKDGAVPSRFDCMPVLYRPSCAIKSFRKPPRKREFIPKIVTGPAVEPVPTSAHAKPNSEFLTVIQFEYDDVNPCSLFTNSSPYLLTEVPTFCHECKKVLEGPCVLHGKHILDPPYSRNSLPADLVLRVLDLEQEIRSGVVEGVFAVKQIPKFSVFGPLVAPSGSVQGKPSSKFGIKTKTGWQEYCLDSDYACNWLKHVRFSEAKTEQNLMAYQQNGHVYFSTLSVIEPGSELKVWYARCYGSSRGAPDLAAKRSVENTEWLSSTLPSSDDLEQPDQQLAQKLPIVEDMVLGTEKNSDNINNLLSVFTENLKDIRKNVSEVNAAPECHEDLNFLPTYDPDDFTSFQEPLTNSPSSSAAENGVSSGSQRSLGPEIESESYDHECVICEARFRIFKLLQIHMISHGKLSREISALDFVCPDKLCKVPRFESMAALMRHVEQHKGTCPPEKSFPCPHCVEPYRKYPTQAMLDGHIKRAHHETAGNGKFHCLVCHQSFIHEKNLVIHKEMGHGLVSARSHQCPVCLRNFDTHVEINQHGESHGIDGVFTCRICSKQHSKFHSLRVHMLDNHGSTPVTPIAECEICGHKSSRTQDMQRHMAVHSNEYKFACEQCDWKFRFPDQLPRHKAAWHDPTNPPKYKAKPWKGPLAKDYLSHVYKCRDCKLGFSEPKLLIRHLDARHPEVSKFSIPELNYPFKPVYRYTCIRPRCRKKMIDEDQCRQHLRTDHGITDLSTVTSPGKLVVIKYYTCDKCDYTNNIISHYQHHLQTAHSESSSSDNL